jgi:hypothetical protein
VDIDQWDVFCDALKRSGQQVLRPGVPTDQLTRAEGYRYLTRLLRLALEKNIEFSDPRFPQFYSLSHETAKIGNDNPDNLYLNCAVSGRYDYRISGQRGTVAYMSLESKAGSYGGSGDMAPTGHIELDALECDAQGQFEILVSTRPQPGNWLPMSIASDNLLVRQTFNDRKHETPARLEIECLNPDGDNVLDPAQFAQQLASVPRFVEGTAALFNSWMEIFREHVNALPANDQAMCLRAGGDPSIHYHNSCWRLEPGEALLIEVSPPTCRTWNFQLSNDWMESLDYRYHRIHINKHSASYRDDGSVQILVAHEDPGEQFPNWLSTAGHTHGAMLFRYVEAETFPPITTRVITLEDL